MKKYIEPVFKQLTLVFMAVFALVLNQNVYAQESPSTALADLAARVSIDVSAFIIDGENPMDEKSSYAIVNRYLGKDKSISDIEAAAEALELALRKSGQSFYRVLFPPQELTDGVIELRVKRYKIGNIIVNGNRFYSDENIISSVPQLIYGSSPSTRAMARSLTVANQNSSKRTRLTLASGLVTDEIDATLSVVDRSPVDASIWLDNTGTDASGESRVGANVTHRNLFGRDHVGALTWISSPEDFDAVRQLAGSYRMPNYRLGGSFNLFAVTSNIDTGTVAEVFNVAGSGEVLGGGYAQVLPKKGELRHQLSLQITDKLFDNDVTFENQQLLTDVRSRPLAVAYQYSWNNTKGLEVRGSFSTTQNLSGGSDNNDRAYQLSRLGAQQSWRKLDAGLNVQYAAGSWLYSAALNISNSSDRLITGEQFSLGGNDSVHGMEERELRGDKGYRFNFQIWGPEIHKTLRPIAFFDTGKTKVNEALEGEVGSESVSSIGVKLNWNPNAKIVTSLSYGYLLDGIDFEGGDSSIASRDGDSKVHFNFTYRF